ncbi:Ig-like domain-containing protein, partial [Chromobacterium phragmitis]
SDGVTSNNQPTITGTAEANSTVTVYIDGVAVGTATADSTGAWSYNVGSALADGNHSIRAMAVDAAGNISGQSASYAITVDTVSPQVQSLTASGLLNTSASTVSYQVVFTKPVASFTADALSVVSSGSARGTVASVTSLSSTSYVVELSGVGGDGSLSLTIKNNMVSDAAGNLLKGTATAPSYQLASPVVPVSTVAPVTVTTTPTFTNTIQLPPITPNIVLAAVSGSSVSTANNGNAIITTGQTILGSTATGLGTGILTPTFGAGDSANGSAPSFISSTASNPTIALQVNPDLGVRPLVTGQSFTISLPPATIITRESSASLSIAARQSNGQPLPAWLRFDPASGKFTGQAPAGWNKPISIDIQVQDKSGHHGNSHIQLNFGQRQAATPPAGKAAAAAAGKQALNQQFEQHGQHAFEQRLAALLEEETQG